MPQSKYILFKAEDATKFLNPEQRQHLMSILQAINAGRRSQGRSVGDLFWVLNMKDQFARTALDAYIQDIHFSGLANTVPAVQDALTVAVDVKQTAAMNIIPKIPD